mmetsp:Transcript_21345/g.48150  ORF Transcript_21345/g.48150 Transcript_21345/m.48150 type:complete len:380 (+) Transcript_21345:560-1699(+)
MEVSISKCLNFASFAFVTTMCACVTCHPQLAPWFSVAELLTSGVETRQWDYFINLSGDAWPVLRPEPLRRALGRVSPFNFVACSSTVTGLRPNAWHEFDPGWHKRKAFPYPIVEGTSAEAYYGSQWMVVSAAFVRFVIAELLDSRSFTAQLADWFAHGTLVIDTGRENLRVRPHIPDEIFFPTVLMNAPSFNGSIGASTVPPPRLEGLRDMTYIRMDEHYPWSNFNQRYASPENASSRPWGPYYLGTYDLANIKRSGALFLRKVSSQVDENLLRILPADSHSDIPNIGWPAQLSPKVAQDSILTEPELKTPGGEPIAPPAPAPVPELPFISVLERGPVGHVDERGCVAVAESIHCPPQHPIDPEEVKKHGLPVGVGFGG